MSSKWWRASHYRCEFCCGVHPSSRTSIVLEEIYMSSLSISDVSAEPLHHSLLSIPINPNHSIHSSFGLVKSSRSIVCTEVGMMYHKTFQIIRLSCYVILIQSAVVSNLWLHVRIFSTVDSLSISPSTVSREIAHRLEVALTVKSVTWVALSTWDNERIKTFWASFST